jgi:hypothetical protein
MTCNVEYHGKMTCHDELTMFNVISASGLLTPVAFTLDNAYKVWYTTYKANGNTCFSILPVIQLP